MIKFEQRKIKCAGCRKFHEHDYDCPYYRVLDQKIMKFVDKWIGRLLIVGNFLWEIVLDLIPKIIAGIALTIILVFTILTSVQITTKKIISDGDFITAFCQEQLKK